MAKTNKAEKEKLNKIRMEKLNELTENMTLTAKEKEPKAEILYIRVNLNLINDLQEMQDHFGFEKRTDLVRTLIENAVKTFRKLKG